MGQRVFKSASCFHFLLLLLGTHQLSLGFVCGFFFVLKIGGALENWPNFQTPQLLMKLWDLLDNMCVVADLKFEQKIPPGSASSSSKTR
jgi:hypothetical protein